MVLRELIQEIQVVSCSANLETEITGVCYDSRKVKPGDAFVAIRGFSSDGHRYIASAIKAGAAVILGEDPQESDIPYIRVENSRKALASVSAAFFEYPAKKMKIIGVTGTSGKTTTTHLIKHILEHARQAKVGMVGTNGNMIGERMMHTEHTTPESYELQKLFAQMAESGCEYVVMEVSSHSISLERIAGVPFAVAAYTNLSRDHLDFHGTMEEYAAAKKKLFGMCACACFNADDEWSSFMMQDCSCPVIVSSAEYQADLTASNIRLSARGVSFNVTYNQETVAVSLGIPGSFSVYNALTAISCCVSLGLSLKECADALAVAPGVKGRVEQVPTPDSYTVLIDYSHKPDALEKVLKTLRPVTNGRLVTLFGCGGDRDRTKRPIMGAVAAKYSDFVIVTSDNPRTEEPQAIIDEILPGFAAMTTPFEVICDRPTAICWALDHAQEGDVILLAGKGHEDYQIIGHEKHHMDEREIVAEHLQKIGKEIV